MNRLRLIIGLSLLAFQIGAIVYARLVPSRYFCWAPFDMQTDYVLHVEVNGRTLSASEIGSRYKRAQKGTDNRSYHHLIDIIRGVEERYHPEDRVEIRMIYRINGKAPEQWHFARP